MGKKPLIGVLALQGCVEPHRFHLEGHGARFCEVRGAGVLADLDGLILPGGESTAMLKLIAAFSMEKTLRETFRRIPVWGICAGAILMAQKVENPSQSCFGLIGMTVRRNAYGRQSDSFNTSMNDEDVAFIRAPVIIDHEPRVEVLETHGGHPVWVRQGPCMATTFHPELARRRPSSVHGAFMAMVRERTLQGEKRRFIISVHESFGHRR